MSVFRMRAPTLPERLQRGWWGREGAWYATCTDRRACVHRNHHTSQHQFWHVRSLWEYLIFRDHM